MNLSKKFIIIIISVVLATCGMGAGLAAALNTPTLVASKAFENVGNILERQEIKPLVDVFTRGSLAFETKNPNNVSDYVSGKFYFSKDAIMLDNFELSIDNYEIIADAYISRDEIYFGEEEILERRFGFNFDTFLDDLNNSIFMPGSGSTYELDEEAYEMITEIFEYKGKNKELEKDTQALVDEVINELGQIFFENVIISSESDEIRINGERESVRIIEIVIDHDVIEELIYCMYDYLCETDTIIEFLEKYEDTFNLMLEDEISIIEEYENFIIELEDELDNIISELQNEFEIIEIKLATPKLSASISKLELKVDNEKIFTLDIGNAGIKNTELITFKTEYGTITYEVSENDNEAFEAKVSISYKGSTFEDIYETTLKINKERETYTLTSVEKNIRERYDGTISEISNSTVIKGDYIIDSNKTTISIDKITEKYYLGDEFTQKFDFKVIINTNDKMPKLEKYETIDEIEEEDMYLFGDVLDIIGDYIL